MTDAELKLLADELWSEEMRKERRRIYETMLKTLPCNRDTATLKFTKPEIDIRNLFPLKPSPLATELAVDRDLATGAILRFKEVPIQQSTSSGGLKRNALSLKRTPAPPDQGIMGSTSNSPFLPGGMEDEFEELMSHLNLKDAQLDVANEADLLTIPPGFKRGVDFDTTATEPVETNEPEPSTSDIEDEDDDDDFLDLMDLIGKRDRKVDIVIEDKTVGNVFEESTDRTEGADRSRESNEVEESEDTGGFDVQLEQDVLEKTVILKEKEMKSKSKEDTVSQQEFAVKVDVSRPVTDLQKRIPYMARKWPFTLDPFQQQAILCLERGDSVFVSAHTSAGKTVVAEYAVALCKRHLSRAIYTSPIKALSNQKFREFKMAFEDVGLITGDIQLKPEAFCLIMTTEILRSMLYNGSEIVRELEYVIFDEVHYINDAERGVVWEEVLIMLPSHIKIIMLSATVPNTMEFADWVGRIKNRKIYVISTLKRPVPLEHFLYTGTDGKTKDERFLLIDKEGKFLMNGYKAAVEAKTPKKPVVAASQKGGSLPQLNRGRGRGAPRARAAGNQFFNRGGNFSSEKQVWVTLIDHLNVTRYSPWWRSRFHADAATKTPPR